MIFFLIYFSVVIIKTALWKRWAPEVAARFARWPNTAEWWLAWLLGNGQWVLPLVMTAAGVAPDWSDEYRISGVPLFITGNALFLSAVVLNPEYRVEITTPAEWCDRWLYRVLRHPGYIGFLLMQGGVALMMGYKAGAWLYAVYVILILARVVREERFLWKLRP